MASALWYHFVSVLLPFAVILCCEKLSPSAAALGEAVVSLGVFDGIGELETHWDPRRWEERGNGKI